MLSVTDFFLLFSAIILLGWLGQVFFDRTRIPDVLLLLGLGLLLGPGLGILEPSVLRSFAPHFGTLALVIILFEGGLKLKARELFHQFAPSTVLTLLAFSTGTIALASLAHYVFDLEWVASFFFGAILSGAPSGVVAIPVINQMNVSESTRTVVSLEASLSDILAILSVVMALSLLSPGTSATVTDIPVRLLSTFLISALFAGLVGLGWLAALNAFRGHSLSYMLTLAVLFLSYSLTEKAGGSGALAVLLTGAIVANASAFFKSLAANAQVLAREAGVPEDSATYRGLALDRWFAPVEDSLLRFNTEMSFIVRTFFFVFLGAVALPPANWTAASALLLAFAASMAARALAVGLFTALFRSHRRSLWAYLIMAPRGLAAAVLAYLPASQGLVGTESFPSDAFGFIVLSNILLTLGVPLVERGLKRDAAAMKAHSQNDDGTGILA